MAKKRLTKEEVIKRNKRIRRKVAAGIFIVFALIGVGTVVNFAVQGVIGLLDDSDEKAYYEELYSSFVALDPIEFDITVNPPEETILEASIWSAVKSADAANYSRDDNGALLVPAADVAKYIKLMFSEQYEFEHMTFSNVDLEYIYDITTGLYTVPLTGLLDLYTPKVVAITNSGGTRILSVAYMTYGDAVYTGNSSEANVVAKYMEFVLVKEDGDYRLTSVRTPELSVTPSV